MSPRESGAEWRPIDRVLQDEDTYESEALTPRAVEPSYEEKIDQIAARAKRVWEWRTNWNPERLRAAREASGLSQDALGKLLGSSGYMVFHWEKGHVVPAYRWLEKLAYFIEQMERAMGAKPK